MSQGQIEANSRTSVVGDSATRNNGEIDPDNDVAEAIGSSELVDQGKGKHNRVIPKAKLDGGKSRAKTKGPTETVVDLTGDVEGEFNSAPREENLLATTISKKGANMQRIKGNLKHVKGLDTASALAESRKPKSKSTSRIKERENRARQSRSR